MSCSGCTLEEGRTLDCVQERVRRLRRGMRPRAHKERSKGPGTVQPGKEITLGDTSQIMSFSAPI